MVAWRGAYQLDQTPPGDTLINWHDRWLWPTLHRLNTQLRVWTKCTAGVHHATPAISPPTDGADFAGFLDAMTVPAAPTIGGQLSGEQVRTLLDRGEAVALLPADPASPVRHHGMWHAIPVRQPPDTWKLVQPDDNARLDALLHRRDGPEQAPVSGSP